MVQPTLIVELQRMDRCGYGEATTDRLLRRDHRRPRRGVWLAVRDADRSAASCRPIRQRLWQTAAATVDRTTARLPPCAVDQAAHDLWGKKLGQPVYRLWGLHLRRLPFSDYTIGIDTIEKMVAKLQEFAGWPIYKIKLGTPDDLAIVRELRRHTDADLPRRCQLRLDAEQTIANSARTRGAGRRVHRAAAAGRRVGTGCGGCSPSRPCR